MKTVAKWLGFKTPKVQKAPTPTSNIPQSAEEARESAKRKRDEERRKRGMGGGPSGTELTDWRDQVLGGPGSRGGFQ